MKAEAEANADTDRAARESADKINAADSLIFQTEKQMKEFGEKIPEEKKGAIEEGVAKLKEAHASQDIAAIDTAMETLNAAWQAASQDMYAASQEGAAGAEGAPQDGPTADAGDEAGGSDDAAEDVEYEEVEEVEEDKG